jgi:beta-lactamase regulating signal transducer with metallopeptidase domain
MNPDMYLQIAGTFLTYCLHLAAGGILCLALARLSSSPGLRFRLWMVFMAGAAAYGLALIALTLRKLPGGGSTVLNSDSAAGSQVWLIPVPWKAALGLIIPAAFWLYAATAALLLAAVLWRQLRLHLAIRNGRPPAGGLTRLFHEMRAETGAGGCDLMVVPGLASPATAFWWKPRILVPDICDEMEESLALTGVLWHELIHVRRRDYLWAVLSDLICAVLFFHPAVWKARRQMRVERELACDREVIAAIPEARADYAESLTRFARMAMLQRQAAHGIDFAAPATFLGERVRAILTETERASRWKIVIRAMGSAALLAIFALLLPVMVVAMRFAVPARNAPVAMTARNSRKSVAESPARRHLHVSDRSSGGIHESQATRMAPPWHPGSMAAGDDLAGAAEPTAVHPLPSSSDHEWQERSAGQPTVEHATLKTVLLQTAGVLVEEGREERAEHPAHKRLPGH